MKRFLFKATILLLLCCISVGVAWLLTKESGIVYTDDIKAYNVEEYIVPTTIFPMEIPQNAEVVSFVYYTQNQLEDIYLELRFNTREEMEQYLANVKYACLTNCKEFLPEDKECFIKTQNIYDQSFEELFCSLYSTSKGEQEYTGYTIKPLTAKIMRYSCNFGAISYSVEDLTVIHTCVYGGYQSNNSDHIPEYFKRFAVPLQEDHQRILYL